VAPAGGCPVWTINKYAVPGAGPGRTCPHLRIPCDKPRVQSYSVVRYGPPGNCTATTVTSTALGNPITVNGVTEYRNTVAVTGLSAGTSYCYRVFTDGPSTVDLLGSNASPQFTTLDAAGSATPFTFDVVGDWGDTTNSGVDDGTLNVNQAGVDAQIAGSGARFILSTGDIGYQGGTQTNYGDLNQTGVDVGAIFGPSYWAVPGQSIPLHGVTGNHGLNSTFLSVWPQNATAAASGGVYSMVSYPSIDGVSAASYPTAYYAFSSGGVRFYVLDASWGNNNVGTATGGSCATVMAAGGWHRFVLHAIVNGTASSVDVSLDGSAVPGLTLTGQDLGTARVARLQIGETTAGRTYDIVLDDVAVAQHAL
jgi:hypothetical protein